MNESILPKRLRELREKNGYLQKYVADKIGVRSNTLSGYENGTRNPDPDIIRDLADLYNVTTDYLLGRTDTPNYEQELHTKGLEYYTKKIAAEYPEVDLMFKDLESFTAEEMKEVYEYIKFKKSQKK
ncbi:helix-turn-helix domain-containing protein [Oceanobacillus oncorhynchi]|uniref:helix-turn-helix domain-containing protein n=1 Tax=Oceanobacillus oncorhynchi TaxID=545501 RepID=UPI0021163AE3|nr:helix-turn-helix transcriptional regulator [Oceanobacillus oncorhynchi]UUI41140.1 helix-turn-helix transcriptional regulator [Oceanobacillus oncorhynchi]